MDEDYRERQRNRTKVKDLIAFWIFGLCNNYGYVVMLTAAEDILNAYSTTHCAPNERNCTLVSTGIILLADIIPAFIIKTLSPFLPYHTTLRVFFACMAATISFLIAATAPSKPIIIFAVALTSFSSGLGEPTFLYHSTYYTKDTISTWSSGTGAAGIVGSLSYSLLRQIGLSSYNTLLIMIVVPLIEFIVYTKLLSSPRNSVTFMQSSIVDDENLPIINAQHQQNVPNTVLSFADKLAIIPYLFIYILPLVFVYFFEYFINQGMYELIVFKNIFITREQQYHWFQVTYQIGVFVARSSVNIIQIKHTWIMAIIQGALAAFFMTEAIYLFVPSIWIIFVLIFIEGLQGGLTYVNTYYRMSQEVMPEFKTFAMNVVALSDCFGIVFAGFFAIYAHNWICSLPLTTNI